jgi:hypothetical protein
VPRSNEARAGRPCYNIVVSYFPEELRLVILIAVNAFVFSAAYRFVRRVTSQDWIGSTLDALLIDYLVQYVSVCVPGMLGILSAESMLGLAIILATALLLTHRRAGVSLHVSTTNPIKPDLALLLCLLFILGYFGALVYTLTSATLVGDDALTYHLPAAGHWLQTGHLGLYNTWFFNPANTYSPLAGSTFLLWLIAPIRADLLADFAQMPALILIFFAILQIARALGASLSIASLAATAALLSRPFISEAILVKDDQFLAAFFLAAIAGCASTRLKDRLGPWRIGIAIGLFFATKYTALLTAPLLLLVIDAPFRAGWKPRHWLTFAACGFAIASPWYLRNWFLAANPIFPVPVHLGHLEIFKGTFIPERSTEMRTLPGAWHALTGGFHSPSQALMIALLILWCIALVGHVRQLKRDPLVRICFVGPILGLAIFFLFSHAALIRYAYPSLLLLFICTAFLQLKQLAYPLIAIITGLSIWGGFEDKELLAWFVGGGVIVTVIGIFIMFLIAPLMTRPRVRLAVWTILFLAIAIWIYVYWHALLVGSRGSMMAGMQTPYPDKWQMWKYIDENVPADQSIAYTNLVFTRPLMGFDYSRRVFYIPTRPGVTNYHDLPTSNRRVTDQQIREFMAKLLTENPDHDLWLKHLLDSGAGYLLIGRQSFLADPPEQAFANADPAHFAFVRRDASGTLYQIRR